MMDKVVQETINYTRQRKIFQQPVLYHQVVHFRLAELQAEIELLRSLLYRCTGGHQANVFQWDSPHFIIFTLLVCDGALLTTTVNDNLIHAALITVCSVK